MEIEDPEWLATQDAEMATAIRAARASFWEFARNVELENWRAVPAIEAALIKGYFPDPNNAGQGQFQFVDEITVTAFFVIGKLNAVDHESAGQRVVVPIDNVCDWILCVGEKIHKGGLGGFTIDVLKQRVHPDQRQEYESYPPVSWYRHRRGTTAQDEMNHVPACVDCGQKDLFDDSYRDGKCGVCANGLARIECKRCGMPIIRSPKQPKLCRMCNSKSADGNASTTVGQGNSLIVKIYTGGVILTIAILAIIFCMMLFDPAGAQAKGRPLMLGSAGCLLLALAGPLIYNLQQKRLATIPTIVQIVALVLSCLGIPFAALGSIALLGQSSRKGD